jgi:ABC-type uncharacterized transport system permease subunit
MSEKSQATQASRNIVGYLLGRVSIPFLAIFTAMIISSLVMWVAGTNPIKAYLALGEGAFGTQKAIIETLIKATPFILAGLGLALAFRGGLFNIGMEGQLFAGSAVNDHDQFHCPARDQLGHRSGWPDACTPHRGA